MKLIDLLVQELPKRGGWPDGAEYCHLTQYDRHCLTIVFSHSQVGTGGNNPITSREEMVFSGIGYLGNTLYDCTVTYGQYESALAESQKPAWNGEGLPPIGCRVEYTCKQEDIGHPAIEKGKWYCGTIIAYHAECVWTSDNGIRHLKNTIFRPLTSKSDNRKYAAIESLFEILDAGVSASQDAIDIYDAISAGKIPGVKLDD